MTLSLCVTFPLNCIVAGNARSKLDVFECQNIKGIPFSLLSPLHVPQQYSLCQVICFLWRISHFDSSSLQHYIAKVMFIQSYQADAYSETSILISTENIAKKATQSRGSIIAISNIHLHAVEVNLC